MRKQFALSGIRRMSVAERNALASKILQKLYTSFPLVRFEALKPVRQKTDFSSLEMVGGIAASSRVLTSIKNFLLTEFSQGENFISDTRLALKHDEFQVDFLFVEPNEFDMTVDHLAYQELGKLISKVAHVQGLSLSGTGLFYRLRDGDRMIANIELANSWSHALAILEYDHARWSQGFDSLEDVFEFVTSSPLFLKSCFTVKPEEPGSRKALRFVFADWLEHQVLPAPVTDPLTWLFQHVPGFEARYNTVLAADKKRHG